MYKHARAKSKIKKLKVKKIVGVKRSSECEARSEHFLDKLNLKQLT